MNPRWTAAEDTRLRLYRGPLNIGFREISRVMGRSYMAVKMRAHKLGLKHPKTTKPTKPKKQFQQRWSDKALTETWADRKARRAAEARTS
jgi:hypothetical protein